MYFRVVFEIYLHTGQEHKTVKNAAVSISWSVCKGRKEILGMYCMHTARIPSPLPLHVAKRGRNHLNEKFTPLLPTGIGERF